MTRKYSHKTFIKFIITLLSMAYSILIEYILLPAYYLLKTIIKSLIEITYAISYYAKKRLPKESFYDYLSN